MQAVGFLSSTKAAHALHSTFRLELYVLDKTANILRFWQFCRVCSTTGGGVCVLPLAMACVVNWPYTVSGTTRWLFCIRP